MRRLLLAVFAAGLAPQQASAQASASPYTSATRYDAMNRVTGTISADPDTIGSGNPFLAVRNTFDQAGRLTKVENGTLSSWQAETVSPSNWGSAFTVLRTLETQYDNMGRKVRDTVREGAAGTIRSATDYSYDTAGRPDCTAVRMNSANFSTALAACTQGTGGADRITKAFYDLADQRVQLREGVGTADEGTEATWAYNLDGQVTTVIDGNGNQAALVYDGHGRQECWLFPSTTRATSFNDSSQTTALATMGALSAAISSSGHCDSGNYETYSYDANGNRVLLRKRDGSTIAYSYDALNRVTVKTPTPGTTPGRPTSQALTSAQYRPVYYGYDLRNLQLFARFDSTSGEGVTSTYDGFGRLASSSTDMGGTTRTLTYAYDRNGNRTGLTHPDTTSFAYSYDGLNRPTFVGTTGLGIAFTSYEAFGLPGGSSRGDDSVISYGYDGLQRLVSNGHLFPDSSAGVLWLFSYNEAGQIASTTRYRDSYAWTSHYAAQRPYTTNGRNQYSDAGGGAHPTTFTYDENGSLMTQSVWNESTLSYVTSTWVYDVENRLVGAPGSVVLTYDPLGRLYRVQGTGTDTRFLYDGDALVAEYNSSGSMTQRYVHWVGADVPVVSFAGSGLTSASYLHADRQGSIVTVSGPSSAAINRYDEYGNPARNSLGENINTGRFQYTGQIWLSEIGMYHYKARVYSPTLGRFLQTDPTGYDGGISLYAYVGNDPVNGADPSGLMRCGDDTPACRTFNGDGDSSGSSTSEDRTRRRGNRSEGFMAPVAVGTVEGGVITAGTVATVVGLPLLLSGDTQTSEEVFVTYTMQNARGTTYSGRSSMRVPVGTPLSRALGQSIINQRFRGHHMAQRGFGPARLDQITKNWWAIRGREQQLIDHYGGAQSSGGTSGNAINGISPYNPLRPVYMSASDSEFGHLQDNSERHNGGGPW